MARRRDEGWLSRAIIAGFIALGVSTLTMDVVSGVAGALGEAFREQNLLFTWMYELTHNPLVELGRGQLFASLAVHLTFGMFLAIVYARVFEPRLRQLPSWLAGLFFSGLPFVFSVLVFLPLVGAGFFGGDLGAGPLPFIGNMILHMIWGATLGAGYGAAADTVAETEDGFDIDEQRQVATMGRAESGAARGILIGVVAGGGIGAVAGSFLPFATREDLLQSWPLAIGVAGALAGGAVGALVGSMSGLTQPESDVIEDEGPSEGQPVAAALLPLGVIAVVATLIISIGELLLLVAGDLHDESSYYYGGPIIAGVGILVVVCAVAAFLSRSGDTEAISHDLADGHQGH